MSGAPSASTVSRMWALASALRRGSMSEAFSGQTTRSGLGARPASTSCWAVEGGRDVVVEDLPALGVEVEPRPGHVALDAEELGGRPVGGQRHREPGDAQHERRGHEGRRPSPTAYARRSPAARLRRCAPIAVSACWAARASSAAAQRDDEPDEGRSAERDEAPER